MSKILRQRTKTECKKTLAPGFEPVCLRLSSGERTVIEFSNGIKAFASCLRCPDTPCATLADKETVPSNFDRFPADRNRETCAAGAITIPDSGGAPSIDPDRCMLCGVCAARCPVGAIRLAPLHGAIVEDAPNEAFFESNDVTQAEHVQVTNLFDGLNSDGELLLESDAVVADVFARLQRASARVGDRFPNLLVRNLFIGAKIGASIGRKGNNHMRMDIVLSPPGVIRGVAEVEFGQEAVLDAPRDLLDSLAVLASRYEWDLRETSAFVVTDVLPNRRSEYWHIVQDIANVFNIQVGTVTVFALMIFNWSRWSLDFTEGHLFYADRDTGSYRTEVLEMIIGRPLRLSAISRSQIEIAK
jgi:ferredoxin